MITMISKCTTGKMNEQNSVDASLRSYFSIIIDTIRALSLYLYRSIVYLYNIIYEHPSSGN